MKIIITEQQYKRIFEGQNDEVQFGLEAIANFLGTTAEKLSTMSKNQIQSLTAKAMGHVVSEADGNETLKMKLKKFAENMAEKLTNAERNFKPVALFGALTISAFVKFFVSYGMQMAKGTEYSNPDKFEDLILILIPLVATVLSGKYDDRI